MKNWIRIVSLIVDCVIISVESVDMYYDGFNWKGLIFIVLFSLLGVHTFRQLIKTIVD